MPTDTQLNSLNLAKLSSFLAENFFNETPQQQSWDFDQGLIEGEPMFQHRKFCQRLIQHTVEGQFKLHFNKPLVLDADSIRTLHALRYEINTIQKKLAIILALEPKHQQDLLTLNTLDKLVHHRPEARISFKLAESKFDIINQEVNCPFARVLQAHSELTQLIEQSYCRYIAQLLQPARSQYLRNILWNALVTAAAIALFVGLSLSAPSFLALSRQLAPWLKLPNDVTGLTLSLPVAYLYIKACEKLVHNIHQRLKPQASTQLLKQFQTLARAPLQKSTPTLFHFRSLFKRSSHVLKPSLERSMSI